jgi:hypothetical protein
MSSHPLLVRLAILVAVPACYDPSLVVGAPCPDGHCPGDQVCDLGAPGGPVCVDELEHHPPDAPVARTCGPSFSAVTGATTGATYRAVPMRATFDAAEAACALDGAHVAVIDDDAEARALDAFLADDPSSPYFWVGVGDWSSEGEYTTVAGARATYLPWGNDQPTGASDPDEDCALQGTEDSGEPGALFDYECDGLQYYVCECGP